MARASEFVAHLLDLLAPLGEVSARGMFGGWGIYHEGRIFGIVVEDIFYLKADDGNRAEFEAQNLPPFSYETKKGKRESMSYHTVPSDTLDSSPLLCEWARKGIDAAERAAKKGARKKSKSPRQAPK
jgi:DNA transformation protein and related proteins